MSNYIFTVTDQKYDGQIISAEKKLEIRKGHKKYGLKRNSWHRKSIILGDRIIFYLASPLKVFAGSAVTTSLADKFETDAVVPGDQYYTVDLKDFIIWDKYKPIQDFFGKVDFIKRTDNWGAYLQGGVIKISDKDYDTITK